MVQGTSDTSETEQSGVFSRVKGIGRTSTDEPGEEETEAGGRLSRARQKYGIAPLLIVAGIALFLFPEPATSTAGTLLIAGGVILYIVKRIRK